jgi:hypothetical protein
MVGGAPTLVCRGSSASFHDGRQHIRETSSARGALWSQPSAPASVLVVRLPGSGRCFLRPGSRSLEHPSGRPALRCGAALHDLGEQDRQGIQCGLLLLHEIVSAIHPTTPGIVWLSVASMTWGSAGIGAASAAGAQQARFRSDICQARGIASTSSKKGMDAALQNRPLIQISG